MKFSIKDFFSKCDQILSFLRIRPHLLKKSVKENFIFRAVIDTNFFTSNQYWKSKIISNLRYATLLV